MNNQTDKSHKWKDYKPKNTCMYCINALSFYRSKMISVRSNYFGRVQIILVMPKLFWSGPNHFGQVHIRLLWTNLYDLDSTKTNWNRPK